MDQKTRIEKIKLVEIEANKCWEKEIERMWELKLFPVYKIPLDYLIYNKYNWRIITFTKSLERQRHVIDPATDEWKEIIEKFLRDSKPDRNKRTMENIRNFGQKEVWIITKDWIIIDWNRRAMLINKINESHKWKQNLYFKAVILPVTSEENRIEIEKLEISYQMWEDKKLDYNPIEKYIKADDLIKEWQWKITEKDIADWMWESESFVRDLIFVKKTMDEYLEYLWYNWIYTQLDWREDHLINLTKRLSNFYTKDSVKWFKWYTDVDVDKLKFVAFDYIRIKFEGKNFRNLAEGSREKHIFGNEEIWKNFINEHFDFIKKIKSEEGKIDLDSKNLTASLNARDEEFMNKAGGFMEENFELHKQKVKDKSYEKEPDKMIDKALDLVSWIANNKYKINNLSEWAKEKFKHIETIARATLHETWAIKILDDIIESLSSIRLEEEEDKDHLSKKISEIYNILAELEGKLW